MALLKSKDRFSKNCQLALEVTQPKYILKEA
jgi:hypothetical protein